MPDDKVKLPRSSYEELCRIIRAYGRSTQAASLEDVSRLSTMSKEVITRNNSFLASIGLIEGGKTKSATARGTDLANALEYENPDTIQQEWARVVNENEFLNKMAVAIKIRKSMETSAVEAHIAYSAGEAKSSRVMTGARAVVDILRAAGVVREEDGHLVAGEPALSAGDAVSETTTEVPTTRYAPPSEHRFPLPSQAPAEFSVRIELRIDAKPNELEGLGAKIRQLIRDLEEDHKDNGSEPSAQP